MNILTMYQYILPVLSGAQELNKNKIFLKIQNRTDDTLHYDYACAV